MPDETPPSFRELFLRHRRGLFDYLRRRVGPEDASDLLQETFVRALRRERFEMVDDPPAFLKQIAVNLSRDLARRKESEAKYFVAGEDADDVVDRTIAPDDLFDASERARRFLAAVEALPPKCRQAFVLRRFEDLSHDEIAARLGVTRNMVEKHLRLALERLRAALD
ncbi:RNA polymerase sigma factor [Methylosinus sp. Sm6]|uniref:RNA polymerase sigma factor n=1 Tax=Methylosinus sp. Sm6 TaxID=2866948 RepID=UPI001C992E91|nr:sigma-70 family RNA polymerase sigma factor [Methylosinus sp. Sm6]MBY6242599.1 sigma-70 family RNA polymerase sigma factor [Methylosinus sp. Sm6]